MTCSGEGNVAKSHLKAYRAGNIPVKFERVQPVYQPVYPQKGAASIPTNDLVPPIRRTRNHHSLAFQIPMAGTDIYKSSFFPQTIRDWNLVTDSLITASECAVDSVIKFTSLVRARD